MLVLLLLAVGTLGACSDSEPTPAAYFEALEGATTDYADAIEELDAVYGEELAAELEVLHERTDFADISAVDGYFDQAKEVAIVKTAERFSQSTAELRDYIDAIEVLEPPEGLVEAHQDAVAGAQGLAAAMPLTIEAVRNLDAIEELDETVAEAPYTLAAQRFGIACVNLESAAEAQGITIELACPGGEEDPSDTTEG